MPSNEQMVVDAIRQHIAGLEEVARVPVERCIEHLRDMQERYPTDVWSISIALLGAEMAAI